MGTHSETPFTNDGQASMDRAGAEGAAVIGVSPGDDPKTIVEAIDAFVYAWQGGKRPSPKVLDPEDAPYALGALWGQQIVRRFRWDWRTITFHEHNNSKAPGVLSPDRALALYPIHFLIGCLRDPRVDATILLSYNMLEAGKLGETTPGAYENLMEGVQRIVPRGPAAPSDGPPHSPGGAGWLSRIRRLFGGGSGEAA